MSVGNEEFAGVMCEDWIFYFKAWDFEIPLDWGTVKEIVVNSC